MKGMRLYRLNFFGTGLAGLPRLCVPGYTTLYFPAGKLDYRWFYWGKKPKFVLQLRNYGRPEQNYGDFSGRWPVPG